MKRYTLASRRQALKDLKDLSLLSMGSILGIKTLQDTSYSDECAFTANTSPLSPQYIACKPMYIESSNVTYATHNMKYFRSLSPTQRILALNQLPKLVILSQTLYIKEILNTPNPIILYIDSIPSYLQDELDLLLTREAHTKRLIFLSYAFKDFYSDTNADSIQLLKETLKRFMSTQVNFTLLGGSKRTIVKEAYAKLWYYLDMGENKEIEHYLRHKVKVKPSYYKLENLTSDKYIATKLKKAKRLSNDDENFIEVEGNAKGGVKFNRDFAIQLKRIAEYNYRVYTGAIPTEENAKNQKRAKYQQNADFGKADKSYDEYLCGNLIYDEDYIPTTLDIVDKNKE